MKIRIKTWLSVVLWLVFPVVTRAQTLDNFNVAVNDLVHHYIYALAVQPDGRIWIGGDFSMINGQTNQALARVRADGSLDTVFNPGAASQDFTPPRVSGLVIQSDGKVIAGGRFTSFAGMARTNLVRLDTNGLVDASFNPTFVKSPVVGLAAQSDGKIIAASGPNVYRINTDGTRDTSFNVSVSYSPLDLDEGSPIIDAMAIQPDGKILLCGAFTNVNGSLHPLVARVNANGTIDSSFNYYQGFASPAGSPPDEVVTMTIQPDGEIVLGTHYWIQIGFAVYSRGYRTLRVTSTGALDSVMASPGFVNALTLQTDGKILAGSSPLYRMTAAGTIDTNFVTNVGTNTMPFFQTTAGVNVLALQPDGRLLFGSHFGSPVGRLVNTDAATNVLKISGSTITWGRTGAGPEVWRTTFDYSTNYGASWTNLGTGTRVDNGWYLTGASVPTNANIRARGYIVSGNSSSWFVESIIGPVLLTGQPDSRTNYAGTVAGFFATAGGTSLSYQWLKNGTNLTDGRTISGAQTSALIVSNVLIADAAQYSLVVSNYSGSLTSRVANLTVIEPYIVRQPTNSQTLGAGQTAVLSVTAAGTSPSYCWLKDGVALFDAGKISGTTTPTLVITNLDGGNAGYYQFITSNSFGSVTSDWSYLSVIDPFILSYPSNLWVSPGQTATFHVTVGGASLACQWMVNSTNIPHATNATLVISNCQPANNGIYHLAVNGFYGATNVEAQLTVTIATPAPFETAVLSFTNYPHTIDAAIFQADGKILVGGSFSQLAAHGNWYARTNLGRLNSDGSLDLTFSPPAPRNPNLGNCDVWCLAEQTDGKVLVGGDFWAMDNTPRFGIARLNPDGTLDTTFQNNMAGIYTNSFGIANIYAIAVDANGRILIGGQFVAVNGVARNSIARLNLDGSLDTSFQNGMSGLLDPNLSPGYAYSIALQPDGKVLVGGSFSKVNGVTRNNIARLNTDGSLDTSFQNGMAGTSLYGSSPGTVVSLLLQPDGKVVIGGYFDSVNNIARNQMARLNSNGSLDAPFNPSNFSFNYAPTRIALQTDGQIIGPGSGTIRVSVSGALDPSFGLDAYSPAITTLAENGQVLVTDTSFFQINGQPRSGLCLLNNNPATRSLTNSNSTITWLRGGTSPEVCRTTFDLSTNSGAVWSSLGNGTRISGGWQLIGSNIPTNSGSILCARGFAATGDWFVETLLLLGPSVPSILVNDGSFGIVSSTFGFNFTGDLNQIVVIEGSTNLVTWLPLQTNTLNLAPVHFGDPNWTNFPKRFYRARLQ